MSLAEKSPAQITYVDSSGDSRDAAVSLEAVDSNDAIRALLESLDDSAGATRARLEAALGMASFLALGDLGRVAAFRIGSAEAPLGWLIGVGEPSSLQINIGPLRLFRASGQRLRLVGGFSLCRVETTSEVDFIAAAVSLVAALRSKFIVMLQTVSPEDGLARIASELGRAQLPRFDRQYIPQPRYFFNTAHSFDAYLAQLSSNSRATFRRNLRNFDTHFDGQTELRCFSTEQQVTAFIEDATTVSRRTWQWHEPGRGMQNRAAIEARLRRAAQLGHFCSFVLYGRGEPIAFIEGFLAGGVYVPFEIGFVQELGTLSVGTVCQLQVLRFMHESPTHRARVIDYLDGDDEYKRRMSNMKSVETSYRALPDGLQWAYATALLKGIELAAQFMRLLKKSPHTAAKAGAWVVATLPDDLGMVTDLLAQV